MSQVVIAIGSNYQRDDNIAAALDALAQESNLKLISPVYESVEVDNKSTYYNLVVVLETQRELLACKQWLRDIENQRARERNRKTVTLDLDLLLFDDLVRDQDPVLPHPDILCCEYVLRPLADILPEGIHPVVKKAFKTLWLSMEKNRELSTVDFVWQGQLISTCSNFGCL